MLARASSKRHPGQNAMFSERFGTLRISILGQFETPVENEALEGIRTVLSSICGKKSDRLTRTIDWTVLYRFEP
jgi:hypothetical protein